jgi:hypothetical protein
VVVGRGMTDGVEVDVDVDVDVDVGRGTTESIGTEERLACCSSGVSCVL